MTARVLLANADVFERLALRTALEEGGIEVVGEAGTPVAVLEQASALVPQVVIIEAGIAGATMGVVSEIVDRWASIAVVVLTSRPSAHEVTAAVRAGARGYLPAETPVDRLPSVVRGVLGGEAAIPRRLMLDLLRDIRRREVRSRSAQLNGQSLPLSSREHDVLALLARGLPDRTIAERLELSEVTVRRHAASAARKLGVSGRKAAAALYGLPAAQRRVRDAAAED